MTEPSSTATIELSWQPEAGDYVEAFAARNGKRKLWLMSSMFVVIGVAFAAGTIRSGDYDLAAAGVVIALAGPFLVHQMLRASSKGLWRLYPVLHEPSQAAVDPLAGIAYTGTQVKIGSVGMAVREGRTVHPWQTVDRVLETERVYVVNLAGHDGKAFFLIAKRAAADAEVADLRRMLMR